jgi:selenocysteine-specific elongation factor
MLGDRLYAQLVVDDLRSAVLAALQHHHAKMPWRRGMPRDELKSRTAGAGGDRLFDAVLADLILNGRVREERMRDERSLLALADHQARLTDEEHRLRTALLAAIERGGIAPPPVEELRRLGAPAAVDRMLQVLLDDGVVTAVAPDLRVAATAVERARRVVVEMLRSGRDVTVGTVRDQLQTSRRYALALLEYFDGIKVTRRAGDRRVAGPRADDVHG